MGRVPDLHGSLAAPVQDVDALVQSGTSDISDNALKLQGILKRLDAFYSNRYILCDCVVLCTCCRLDNAAWPIQSVPVILLLKLVTQCSGIP